MSNKPAKNHPWRKGVRAEVYTWAKSKSAITKTHDFQVGQLSKEKSKK